MKNLCKLIGIECFSLKPAICNSLIQLPQCSFRVGLRGKQNSMERIIPSY